MPAGYDVPPAPEAIVRKAVVPLSLLALAATLGVRSAAAVNIAIDLSYVDTTSIGYQKFKQYVDDEIGGADAYNFSATDAAYLYRLTGQQQYATLAVNLVEAQVSAAETAIAAAQAPDIAGDSYLEVGPLLRDLALTYDWCADSVTSGQKARWAAYAEQAVYNVWNPALAQWGGNAFPWTGFATDDPGDNYYYSFTEATMYWGLASGNSTWLDRIATNNLPALDAFYAQIAGGGSQEGTGYGLSHRVLFELYRVWRDASATHADYGNINSHLTDSVYWWTHATVPTLDRVAPIGDQARVSEPVIYDYHREVMLQARRMTGDATAQSVASWWLHAIDDQDMQSSFNYRDNLLPAGSAGAPPASLVYSAPGTGQLFARTDWGTGAMWLQFAAGPYLQSHAHQDQGSFTLFESDWLAVTENIWSHSGIQQGTEVHNLVRFENGGAIVPQATGTTSTMTVTPLGGGDVHAEANLTPAYDGNAAVGNWQRTIDFAARKLTIHDTFTLGAGTSAIFQINVPVQPTIDGQTAHAGNLTLHVLTPADATLSALDWTTVDADFLSGWRIDVSGATSEYVVEMTGNDVVFANGFDATP